MTSYRDTLYAPQYALDGVAARLELSNGNVYDDLVALDLTSGVELPGGKLARWRADFTELEDLRPGAALIAGDLFDRGIALASLDGAKLGINLRSWRVNSYREKPSPNGIEDGEVFLLLEKI